MTFCLVLAVPGISLAAADTRVNLIHQGNGPSDNDGPEDFVVSVADRGYQVRIPFRFRKLRPLSRGWITSAGDYLLGKVLLDLLARADTCDAESVIKLLDEAYPLAASQIEQATGFAKEQLSRTALMGAPFIGDPKVWMINFSTADKSLPSVGQYCANWPTEVPDEIKAQAIQAFEWQVRSANGARNIAALAKAAVQLIATAQQHSQNVGVYAQVGITVGSPDGMNASYYVEGCSDDLLGLSDGKLEDNMERLR